MSLLGKCEFYDCNEPGRWEVKIDLWHTERKFEMTVCEKHGITCKVLLEALKKN